MKEKRKSPEQVIKHLLKESKAENNALKKLITALQEEELRRKASGTTLAESTKIKLK
jgi:hypothetical protein